MSKDILDKEDARRLEEVLMSDDPVEAAIRGFETDLKRILDESPGTRGRVDR